MAIIKNPYDKNLLKAVLALVVCFFALYSNLLELAGVFTIIVFGEKWLNQIIVLDVDRLWQPFKFLIIAIEVSVCSGFFALLLALFFMPDAGEFVSFLHLGRLILVSILGTVVLIGRRYKNDHDSVRSFSRQAILIGCLMIFLFYFGNPERFILASFPLDDLMDLMFTIATLCLYWMLYLAIAVWSEKITQRYEEKIVSAWYIIILVVALLPLDYLLLNLYLDNIYQTSIYTDYWVLEMPLKLILLVLVGYFSVKKKGVELKTETIKFQVKAGKATKLLPADDILYFQVQYQNTYAVTTDHEKVVMEESLSELEERLSASEFFRLNRQVLARKEAIQGFEPLTNRKLRAQLLAVADFSPFHEISRLRAPAFKRWMAQ
ncbi:MAG: LytTR family DNA-binding domain-containing protein [Reichenbachiella sp.]|uniref:LytTR family DNA-binding domain-containing protein n=1 Tax=Reichenbachiella sp. TaxID=2184521 RepID=UPI0029663DD2|nr:LytTR family DNA-binding domain-containing protein [Reichenbachiella sp.]MDW3209973.1 LytTR family DNA-binding domain-containing protein [Reichenbachiella sp.]